MSQLLQNAVYGGAMILAVAVLRRVLKDRLVPEARLALWAVCLFRLLTPAAPESVLSLWGLGRWFAREADSAPAPGPVVSTPYAGGTFVPEDPAVTAPAAPAAASVEAGIPWEMVLAGIWLTVGAVLAVRFVYAYVRTRRAVECAIPIGRDDPRYAPLPGFARLREGPIDGAPLTFGAARPTVVLTPGLDGEKLVCVLTHEGVHARRRDNLWHYVTALALVIHWWNPAVWLMARLVRRDVELSCDRAAVKKLGADRRAEYAKALVSMATMAEGPAFCQTFGRKAAEERVISIMKYKKTTIIGAALSLALVLGLTAGFASNPVEPGADGQGGIWSVSLESSWIMSWEYSADGSSLAGYSISWSQLEESLANQVTKGELTQEKADEILAWAREATRDEEGKRFRWTFDEDCGLIMENGEVFYVYQDGNGNRVKIDKETFVSSFIYPMANKEISVAVEGGETTPGADAWRMSLEEYKILLDRLVADGKMSREDADWLYAGAKQAVEQAEKDGRAVVIQTNESGGYAIMPAVRNEGVFVITDVDTNGNLVVTNEYGMVLPEGTTMEAYKAVLDRAVSEGNLTPEQAAKWLGEMEDAIEQVRRGEISRLMFNRTNSGPEFTAVVGSDPVEPAAQSHPLCTAELCTVSGPHWHENGEVIHFYYTQGDEPIGEPDLDYDPQVADSAGAGSEPIACPPEAIDKNVSNEACPVEGCTEIMAHQHDGRWYCFLHDVCPVEGCTVSGSHTIHCSGFHSGGVCDGSCASYSSTYPSASSGHHSESHHSSGHH